MFAIQDYHKCFFSEAQRKLINKRINTVYDFMQQLKYIINNIHDKNFIEELPLDDIFGDLAHNTKNKIIEIIENSKHSGYTDYKHEVCTILIEGFMKIDWGKKYKVVENNNNFIKNLFDCL